MQVSLKSTAETNSPATKVSLKLPTASSPQSTSSARRAILLLFCNALQNTLARRKNLRQFASEEPGREEPSFFQQTGFKLTNSN